jgi:CheY-like chemotaxis protein
MLSKKRILVIEDDESSLSLQCYLLEKQGHAKVTAAKDGQEGIELAAQLKPDLIVCDLVMPRMDGFEFLEALRSHKDLKNIPVIAVTGSAMPGNHKTVEEAGFDGYVTKPIMPEKFVNEVLSFMRGKETK